MTRLTPKELAHRVIAAVCVLLMAFAVMPVMAGMKEIKPGRSFQLKEGQGLVVISVDTTQALSNVTLQPKGRFLGGAATGGIKPGHTMQLYVADAGEYTWSQVKLGRYYFPLRKDTDFGFKVHAGKINYPGDLIYRPGDWNEAMLHLANRGLRVLDWLKAKHGNVLNELPFAYSGSYPDPFPAFYLERSNSLPKPVAGNLRSIPEAPALPMPVETLWKRERVAHISVSPGGRYLAEVVVGGGRNYQVDIIETITGSVTNITELYNFDSLQWIDDESMVLKTHEGFGGRTALIRVGRSPEGELLTEVAVLPRSGQVLDVLKDEPGKILMSSWVSGDRGNLQVHRVDISTTKQATDSTQFSPDRRVNTQFDDDIAWFTNGQGELAVAVRLNRPAFPGGSNP